MLGSGYSSFYWVCGTSETCIQLNYVRVFLSTEWNLLQVNELAYAHSHLPILEKCKVLFLRVELKDYIKKVNNMSIKRG